MDNSDRLLDFFHGRLDEKSAAAFEQEISRSPVLQSEFDLLQQTAKALGNPSFDASLMEQNWDRFAQTIAPETLTPPANDNWRPKALRVAGIAALAICAWQFLAVPLLPLQQGAFYSTASNTEPRFALRIEFAPSAKMSDVSLLLSDIGAIVTGGPSAVGLYTLGFESEAQQTAALDMLAARGAIVLTVTQP